MTVLTSQVVAPQVALMVAMANNRCIGVNNALPWHLSEDLKHFKRTTLGKPVIMGRKTFDSIGRPLPGRANIVVTHNPHWHQDGVVTAASVVQAIISAKQKALEGNVAEIVIIGGAQIYREALDLVQKMYITRVDTHIDGDAYFPEFDEARWQRTQQEHFQSDQSNPYDFSFESWELSALA